MHCIYNLYIKKVRANNINSRLAGFFIFCIIMNACTAKKSKLTVIAEEYSSQLQQVKKTKAGSVSMLLVPSSTDNNNKTDLYSVRITLKTNQPVKQPGVMQYMNFNIKNSFYTIQGSDTMPCVICERIPGIGGNDFLYMTWFNKTRVKINADKNLRLLVTDTIAGFGETVFEIKNETLKKLEQ